MPILRPFGPFCQGPPVRVARCVTQPPQPVATEGVERCRGIPCHCSCHGVATSSSPHHQRACAVSAAANRHAPHRVDAFGPARHDGRRLRYGFVWTGRSSKSARVWRCSHGCVREPPTESSRSVSGLAAWCPILPDRWLTWIPFEVIAGSARGASEAICQYSPPMQPHARPIARYES